MKDNKRVKQFNKKRMNRSNSTPNQRRTKEIVDTVLKESETNDYSWYSKFPQFTKDAGTLPFGLPLGQRIPYGATDYYVIPGLLRITFNPGVGYSDSLNSPINRMALRFYTYLRDVQKAAAKYDAADIMMYLMAIDSLYMFWANMRRAYGVAQLYTPVNKYYPRQLLAMLGFDPSIANNLAEFRAYINRFAIALGSYVMPEGFDITTRHMWMCSGLYLDSQSTRAQTMFFVPEGFWMFNNTVETGSELDFYPWMNQTSDPTNLHTLADIQEIGDNLLNAIIGDQDTGNISGDLYVAFPNKLRKLVETPEGYTILPIYDRVVLSQIENCTLTNVLVRDKSDMPATISQNPSINNGAIIYKPAFRGNPSYIEVSGSNVHFNAALNGPRTILNMHMDSPTAMDVIEATRLLICTRNFQAASSNNYIVPDSYGADTASRMTIGIFNPNTGALSQINVYTNGFEVSPSGSTQDYNRFQLLALKHQFDWAPIFWMFDYTQVSTSQNANLLDLDGEIDNLTVVTYDQLNNMHEASLLSMLDVPQMGI